MAHIHAATTDQPLDVRAAISQASSPELGGLGVFIGTVRESAAVDDNASKGVVGLEYEAHAEMVCERLQQIAAAASDRWDVRRIVAIHRTGHCDLGAPTVVVACGAPHRADALEACRWIIDEIKATVPIWKREIYSDGSAWVGAQGQA
jgi:molybdopterin synthase catalytic subunit